MAQSKILSPENYQLLFDNMISGCIYSRIITDKKGKPVNYRVLAVNKVYEKIIGKKSEEVIGRLITEIHPDVKKDGVDWISIYGKVALTGEKWGSEAYSEVVDMWMQITAYCPRKGDFVVTFDDITAQKKAEEKDKKQLIEIEKIKEKLNMEVEQFQAFMDHAPLMAYIKNDRFKHLYANRKLLSEYNVDFEKFVGTRSDYRKW
jgi:PAS domain-containing protein